MIAIANETPFPPFWIMEKMEMKTAIKSLILTPLGGFISITWQLNTQGYT